MERNIKNNSTRIHSKTERVKSPGSIPETITDGYKYYLFLARVNEQIDAGITSKTTHQGGFISDDPEVISDLPSYPHIPDGTEIIIAEVNRETFVEFSTYLETTQDKNLRKGDISKYRWITENIRLYLHTKGAKKTEN